MSPSRFNPKANSRAARIGPMVWELEGPMPTLKMSKTLRLMRHLWAARARAPCPAPSGSLRPWRTPRIDLRRPAAAQKRPARAAEACLGEARGARARGSEREGSSILGFMNEAVIGRLRGELAGLREQGLYKTERVLASPQGGVVRAGGRDVINLCANNYLGLANHPAVRAAAQRAIDEPQVVRSEEHTSELQSHVNLV